MAVVYVGYERVRAAAPTRVATAFANAALVERVERLLRLDVELGLNEWFVAHPALVTPANVYYQLAHPLVTLAVLVLLYVRRRDLYGPLRSALVAASVVGLVGYWLVPTAPPRFALDGAVDVLTTDPTLLAASVPQSGLVNLYAAMPSLHAGWAVWVAIALHRLLASSGPAARRWRHVGWLYPLLTSAVVVVTANHYLLDVVAGAAVVVCCDLAVRAASRTWQQPAVVLLPRDVPADA